MERRAEPGLYDYLPWVSRPKISWPNDARIAVWVAPNIEFYELMPPPNMTKNAWQRPNPDVMNYAWRDYGNRVGVFRMIDAMRELDVRGSVSLNVAVCQHHPEIIRKCVELNWELFSHGIYNTRFVLNMTPEQEREMVADVIKTIHDISGQHTDGWLSPSLSNNPWTMDLLAEAGVTYTCDLFHDDQPTPIRTATGRMCSVPYSLEMNDVLVYTRAMKSPREYGRMIKRQFDQLYAEGAENGTVLCVPLHPYLIGQPHRLEPFVEALDYIKGHDEVWWTTGREIAHWYNDKYRDAALAHAGRIGAENAAA
jgi:peptidoglycan/xylan/chitin deacetylase (PgdA/CDA1 family)